jgi:hypothetical protein
MNNNWDKYLDPPDDPPCCEDGCGETLEQDRFDNWSCPNPYCPKKFTGVEHDMAVLLMEANETIKSLTEDVRRLKLATTKSEKDIKSLLETLDVVRQKYANLQAALTVTHL